MNPPKSRKRLKGGRQWGEGLQCAVVGHGAYTCHGALAALLLVLNIKEFHP